MATKREITRHKNNYIKAVKEKDWEWAEEELIWLSQLIEAEKKDPLTELLKFLNTEIKNTAGEATLFRHRGMIKRALKDTKDAIADFDEAIKLQPEEANGYNNRGVAKAQLNDFAGAIADFNKAIKLQPDNASAYNNRGNVKAELEDFAVSMADYDKAILLKPDYANAYNNRGNVKADLGDYEGALADYDKALQLDPNLKEAELNRALAAARMDAPQAYREALRETADPEGIQKIYRDYIDESFVHLKTLRTRSLNTLGILLFFSLLVWGILFFVMQNKTGANLYILLVSISLTTAFLSSPIYFMLRRNHHDQRVERLAIEDYKRTLTLLQLRMLDGSEEARADRTSKAFDHFAHNSTVEVLERNFQPKYFAKVQRLRQAGETEGSHLEHLLKKLIALIKGQS